MPVDSDKLLRRQKDRQTDAAIGVHGAGAAQICEYLEMHKISLGRHIGTVTVERLLSAQYEDSKKAKGPVVFDGGYLKSGTLLSLSLLLLWMRELIGRGKQVRLDLSKGGSKTTWSDFHRLLHLWRFVDISREFGATVSVPTSSRGVPQVYSPSAEPVVGLHFFETTNDFDSFLDEVADRQQEIFRDTSSLGLIGSGELRNVVLRELVSNVFDHGDGRAAFTAMNELPAPHHIGGKSGEALIDLAPRWEQQFLANMSAKRYLEVVVGDFGPGIYRTLRKTWESDPSGTERQRTKHLNVVEYAFEKYSSSKEDPGKFLEDLIDRAEGGEARNPTGLYFVKAILRDHGGLLSVRTGRSWLSWDFSRGPDPRAMTHYDEPRLGTVTAFPGCQYRLLFPLSTAGRRGIQVTPSEDLRFSGRASKTSKLTIVSLDLDTVFIGGSWDSKETLTEVTREVRLKLDRDKAGRCLFVAVNQAIRTKRQALILTYLLAEMQSPGSPVVVVASSESWHLLELAAREVKLESRADEFPVLVLDTDLRIELLGGDAQERDLLARLVANADDEEKQGSDGLKQVPDASSGRLQALRPFLAPDGPHLGTGINAVVSATTLDLGLESACQAVAANWALESPRGIRTTGRFLLPSPSNAYCENFWDVGEVVGDPGRRDVASFLIGRILGRLRPELVLALSFNAGELGRDAIRRLARQGEDQEIDLDIVDDPHQQRAFLPLAFRRGDERTVVLTDVMGTGTVLLSALRLASLKNIAAVVSVVDARTDDSDLVMTPFGEVPLLALVRSPQQYFRDLPRGWTYSGIRTIDPVRHKIMAGDSIGLPDLAWGENLEDILAFCASSEALECGHFSSGKRHFSTFVLTARLVEENRAQIQESIIEELEVASRALPETEPVQLSHILFNEESSSVARIAQDIAGINTRCRAAGIPVEVVQRGQSIELPGMEDVRDILILEPAASSGNTARALLSVAGQTGSKRIFLFILADRMQLYNSWLLSNISGLGSARVFTKRFMSLASRAYPIDSCPQCRIRREYERVMAHAGESSLVEEARSQFAQREPIPISIFQDPGARASEENQVLAAKEAAAQSQFHAGISDIELRSVLGRRIVGRHSESLECCGVLLAFGRESVLFDKETGPLREVLYPTVRRRLVETALAHLRAKRGEVHEQVRRASAVAVVELGFDLGVRESEPWWGDLDTSNRATGWILCEICRVLLGRGSTDSRQASIKRYLEFVDERDSTGQWAKSVTATRRILEGLRQEEGAVKAAGEPAAAWITCARILRRHGHLQAALEILTSGILNPSRTIAELREYYELSWAKRVRDPVVTVLFPGLAALGPELNELSSGLGQLNSKVIGQVRDLVDESNRAFSVVLGEGSDSSGFFLLEALLRRLKGMLVGEKSPLIALLDSLVTCDLADIEAHLRSIVADLSAVGIECNVDLRELPDGTCLFLSTEDLLTCVQELGRNIRRHAFPPHWDQEKRAGILGRVVSEDEYLLEVQDNGRGIERGKGQVRSDGGLGEVGKIARAYGANLERRDNSPGLRIQTRWKIVRK